MFKGLLLVLVCCFLVLVEMKEGVEGMRARRARREMRASREREIEFYLWRRRICKVTASLSFVTADTCNELENSRVDDSAQKPAQSTKTTSINCVTATTSFKTPPV